jgi:hypothetical protein
MLDKLVASLLQAAMNSFECGFVLGTIHEASSWAGIGDPERSPSVSPSSLAARP